MFVHADNLCHLSTPLATSRYKTSINRHVHVCVRSMFMRDDDSFLDVTELLTKQLSHPSSGFVSSQRMFTGHGGMFSCHITRVGRDLLKNRV